MEILNLSKIKKISPWRSNPEDMPNDDSLLLVSDGNKIQLYHFSMDKGFDILFCFNRTNSAITAPKYWKPIEIPELPNGEGK